MKQIIKDPNETLDWWLCYADASGSNRLGEDTIQSISSVAIDPADEITATLSGINDAPLTDDNGTVHATSTVIAIWLTGGVAGRNYEMTVTFVTAGGRTYDDTILIRCIND